MEYKQPQQTCSRSQFKLGSNNPISPDTIEAIRNNPDIIFVTSAGNHREGVGGNHSFPGEYAFPNIINVGATTDNGQLAFFSGSGPNVDVSSQAAVVKVKGPKNSYHTISGTSFSAPAVANLIARMLLIEPGLTVSEIKEIIFNASWGMAAPLQNYISDIDIEQRNHSQLSTRADVNEKIVFKALLDRRK